MIKLVKMCNYWILLMSILFVLIPLDRSKAENIEEISILEMPQQLEGALQIISCSTPEAYGGMSGEIIRYDGEIASYLDDQVINSVSLEPLDQPYFSSSGRFFATAGQELHDEKRCDLTLYRFDGQVLWENKDVPSGMIHIADDGKIVAAVNGYSIDGSEFLIEFYNPEGGLTGSINDLHIEPGHSDLSPDGELFVTILRGDETDGIVTINDKLVAYNHRGELLWEQTAQGLHFSGQLIAGNDRVYASFYADSGREHYMLIYDAMGNLINQVSPQYPNYGSYHLRISPDGDYLVGFGFHHIVQVETSDGEIRWEWQWDRDTDEDLIYDCIVTSDGGKIIAAGYMGKPGRTLFVFNSAGELIKQHQYVLDSSEWGDIRLWHKDNSAVLLDNASGMNLHFSK
ncbi:MAG: hypothetical protein GY839_07670 [candidate division Zixibacteria bacterium]|nr:hypothetical protein [candidate division Zixibacteria bacterium]